MFASKQLYLSSGEVDPLTREPFIIQVTISDFPPAPDIPPPDFYYARIYCALFSNQNYYIDWDDGTALQQVIANTRTFRDYLQGGTYNIKVYGNNLASVLIPQQPQNYDWVMVSNVAQARYPTATWTIKQFGNASFFGNPANTLNAGVWQPENPPGATSQLCNYSQEIINNFPNTTLCTSFNNMFNGINIPSRLGFKQLFPYPQISNWNTQNVIEMISTFGGTNFQENINTWNVGKVTTFRSCFQNSSFNQPLDNWNVSSATDMRSMFNQSQFNQNVGMWQLNKANSINSVNLANIFFLSGMSTENYSKTLIGWANYVYANGGSPNGVNMSGQNGMSYNNTNYGGTPFSDAYAARTYLTSGSGGSWFITGDTAV